MRIISPLKVPSDQSHGHPPPPAHAPGRSGEREGALGPTRFSPGSPPGSETARLTWLEDRLSRPNLAITTSISEQTGLPSWDP